MAKNDWTALQAQFEHDHDKYGTSAKDWCEAKGLNYQSARRYIKVRTAQNDNAQSAQKQTAQSKSAQSAQNKAKPEKKKVLGEKSQQDKSDSSNSTARDSENHKADKPQRDEKGLFLPGNTVSIGCPGNPKPSYSFEPGNQLQRKGGIYARLFPDTKQVFFDFSEIATLDDELMLARTQLQSAIEYAEMISEDLRNARSMDERISLYDNLNKTQQGIGFLMNKVESMTKTLSSLQIDAVNKEKIIQDTKRIKAAARKLALEADKLQSEGKGDDTPVSSIVSDIQSMGKTGLMSE
ncbi:terminase [Vibrio sp. HA2012]|uniref:terminase n=1 Tax=Vibrio sp. HA2012 TaxID=1971595 RepID=UPI000C2CA3EF|nr:terminase [Vibrio sp. HA2012]PJC87825.1 terminase [Vibrio sp. HA2012]